MTPTNHDSKDTKEVASPSPKIFADEKKKTDTGLSSSDSGSVSKSHSLMLMVMAQPTITSFLIRLWQITGAPHTKM